MSRGTSTRDDMDGIDVDLDERPTPKPSGAPAGSDLPFVQGVDLEQPEPADAGTLDLQKVLRMLAAGHAEVIMTPLPLQRRPPPLPPAAPPPIPKDALYDPLAGYTDTGESSTNFTSIHNKRLLEWLNASLSGASQGRPIDYIKSLLQELLIVRRECLRLRETYQELDDEIRAKSVEMQQIRCRIIAEAQASGKTGPEIAQFFAAYAVLIRKFQALSGLRQTIAVLLKLKIGEAQKNIGGIAREYGAIIDFEPAISRYKVEFLNGSRGAAEERDIKNKNEKSTTINKLRIYYEARKRLLETFFERVAKRDFSYITG